MFDASSSASPDMHVHLQESEAAPIADPLADLLLSVAAIIVLAVIAILPTMTRHAGSHHDRVEFRLERRTVYPFVAIERGLIVGEAPSRVIPVDRIFFDEGLVSILERMRTAGEAVVLLVEPNGFEPAIQFEVIANRHGPVKMHQIRLESECSMTRYCHDLIPRPGDQRQ
jgi:hypothetical protein